MKKIFILAVVLFTTLSGFAQRRYAAHAQPVNSASGTPPAARTTNATDTLSNISPSSPLTIYQVGISDSGYATGTNIYNDKAFAERYNIDAVDSSVTILGVLAEFSGKVNPASNKTVTLTVWSESAAQLITATLQYSGFPDVILDSISAPVTNIGIGATTDTIKPYLFATPAASYASFFAGYTINYNFSELNGDTLGLASTQNGTRYFAPFIVNTIVDSLDSSGTAIDTTIYVQNATMQSDNNWYDNYTQNDSLYNDLAIFPIVNIVPGNANALSTKGITRSDLTLFGSYPNPSTDATNIKFSLSGSEDVTLRVMDMKGQLISTITQSNLAAGMHTIPLSTANMPSGDYLCLLHTSTGSGIACKIAVVH